MKLNRFHKQSGATLMEVLIAMTISLVVTAAMIAMIATTIMSSISVNPACLPFMAPPPVDRVQDDGS